MQEHSRALTHPTTPRVREGRDNELLQELRRCRLEIEAMQDQHDSPAWLVTLGVNDWQMEQKLIYELLSLEAFPYEWRWKQRMGDRYGQPCALLAKGRMNTALLEFPDGFRVTTSLNGIRRRKAEENPNGEA